MPELHFQINKELYIKDPQESKFGKRLITHSIKLLHKIGFESFTFKKLAVEMASAEASIYRYFENKHKLLLFLTNWYWEWVSYCIKMNTLNIQDPQKKIKIIIDTIIDSTNENIENGLLNENLLHQMLIQESTKCYHINNVDEENKLGFFLSYKRLAETIASVIQEINPNYPYPKSLASNLLEMANNQIYFAMHLPRLTDLKNTKNLEVQIKEMLLDMTSRQLRELV